MTRGRLVVGAALVLLYAAAVTGTIGLSARHLRPLYDGAAIAPTPYRWVKPPPQAAATNVKPKAATSDITFTNGRTGPGVAAPVDGQFVANFAAGAFAPNGGDTAVHAVVTPLDPAALGAPPTGLHPSGNAYRLQLTYEPSGTPVTRLAVDGDVILTSPFPAASLLYSAGGQSWQKLPTQDVGGPTTVGSTFGQPGYFLVGSTGTSPAAGAKPSGGGSGTVIVAVVVAIAAAVLGLLAVTVARRRNAAAAASAAAARSRRRGRTRARQQARKRR